MSGVTNCYYFGAEDLADQLATRLGVPVSVEFPENPGVGDILFLSVQQQADAAPLLPGHSAFAACRAVKQQPQVRVFLIAPAGDVYTPEIARFCLADGCVTVDDGVISDLSVVESCLSAGSQRTAIDELLESLEREIASDEGRRGSAIQRMLEDQHHDWVLEQLTDKPTGLFAGGYASFKLEEEFKRALRFHQPLSLVLLDLGADALPEEGPTRDMCLAEAASVFLVASRDIDILARFTETTFLFLLPGTGSAGASTVARRMLDELSSREFSGDVRLQPVAGLTTVPSAGVENRGAFLARAEACLRLAQEGRGADGLCVSCE